MTTGALSFAGWLGASRKTGIRHQGMDLVIHFRRRMG